MMVWLWITLLGCQENFDFSASQLLKVPTHKLPFEVNAPDVDVVALYLLNHPDFASQNTYKQAL